jgi:hypothetical protein
MLSDHFPGSRLFRRNPELAWQPFCVQQFATNPAKQSGSAGIWITLQRMLAESTRPAPRISRRKPVSVLRQADFAAE